MTSKYDRKISRRMRIKFSKPGTVFQPADIPDFVATSGLYVNGLCLRADDSPHMTEYVYEVIAVYKNRDRKQITIGTFRNSDDAWESLKEIHRLWEVTQRLAGKS